jgi:hypothetical protein
MHATSLLFLGLLAQSSELDVNASAKAKAQSLLTEGSAFYEKGDYANALERFKAAFAAYDSPKLLFNIGQANRDLGRPVEALEAFEQFLIGDLDAAPETLAEAKGSVTELQKQLGRLRIDCQTVNATISVDGKDVGLTPLPKLLWATPGRHQVTARHWGFTPAIEDVEVRVSNVQPVRIALQEPVAQTLGSGASHSEQPATQSDVVLKESTSANGSSSGWWLGRKWTWVAAGSAVVFSASAIAAGLSMQSKYDSLNKSCGSASPNRLGCVESDIGAVTTRRNVANVLWALAGASAVTGGILFLVEGRPVSVVPVAGETVGFVAGLSY